MPSRALIIIDWIVRILLAAIFIAASFMKLSGKPMMIHEFAVVGLGQGFRYFTGLLELVGGVSILVPRVARYGAGVLLLVDVGAFIAQLTKLHMDVVHTIVIGVLLAVVLYLRGKVTRV